MMTHLILIALCVGIIILVRIGVGVALPQSCPRRVPLPMLHGADVPEPIGVDRIRERLDLEDLGLRWCRDRCGVA